VLEGPVRQDAERRELLDQISESRKNSLARDREEILAITREVPSEWVPGGCLCRETTYTFSKAPQNLPEDFNWDANYVVPGGKDGSNKWAGSHCYCGSCRVSVGALVVTWFTVRREQFKLQKKGPTTAYRSSSHATREFVSLPSLLLWVTLILRLIECSTCGTSLFFHDEDESEFIDITLGSVSAENLSEYIQVTAHIWVGDAEEQTLRSEGEGLGLAAIINDGLPRWKRGGGSERL